MDFRKRKQEFQIEDYVIRPGMRLWSPRIGENWTDLREIIDSVCRWINLLGEPKLKKAAKILLEQLKNHSSY